MSSTVLTRRVLATGLVLLTATAALTGCASAPVRYEGTGTVIGDGPVEANPVEEESSGLSEDDYDEFLDDIDGGISSADQYWTDHWSDFFPGEYTSPSVAGDNGLYDGYDPSTDPGCGGYDLGPENAFYCIPEDFVAWDLSLMVNGFADGDTWVYLVIAHEWGHAIQARIDPTLVADQTELQADCFAGASMFGSAADGKLTFDDGDLAEITTALSRLADATEWTSSGDHGDPFQRIGAFDIGRQGGPTACFAGA